MAMYVNDAFPSKYLNAQDIPDEPVVTIASVKYEMVRTESLPVVTFRELPKRMILKKTNGRQIAKIAGKEDMEQWAGTRIKLIVVNVEFKSELVPAIRVAFPPPRAAKAASRREVPAAAVTDPDPGPDQPFGEEDESEDIA